MQVSYTISSRTECNLIIKMSQHIKKLPQAVLIRNYFCHSHSGVLVCELFVHVFLRGYIKIIRRILDKENVALFLFSLTIRKKAGIYATLKLISI